MINLNSIASKQRKVDVVLSSSPFVSNVAVTDFFTCKAHKNPYGIHMRLKYSELIRDKMASDICPGFFMRLWQNVTFEYPFIGALVVAQ